MESVKNEPHGMQEENDDLITPKEAAQMLGILTKSLYDWIYKGKISISTRMPNGTVRFSRKAIVKFMESATKRMVYVGRE